MMTAVVKVWENYPACAILGFIRPINIVYVSSQNTENVILYLNILEYIFSTVKDMADNDDMENEGETEVTETQNDNEEEDTSPTEDDTEGGEEVVGGEEQVLAVHHVHPGHPCHQAFHQGVSHPQPHGSIGW